MYEHNIYIVFKKKKCRKIGQNGLMVETCEIDPDWK